MSHSKPIAAGPAEWLHPPVVRQASRLVARLLRLTSIALARAARWIAPAGSLPVKNTLQRIEFHADPCAPGGALYLDGELIGRLPGVTRL